jgi:hypothetical protein
MPGVPGSLFDHVQQYAADVAVDDVRPGAQSSSSMPARI